MSASPENWEKLQELFHLAATVPEADRERVLAEACPDPELRTLAMAILGAGEIEMPEAPEPAPTVLTGKIGPYTLLRLLGSGGIGSVYLVERAAGDTALRSALKILAPHAAGPQFVERFRREQKILATLDHPNITRLLDAGITESEQPYLVMEYVDGAHLDAYCDSRKLSIAARLELFLHICDAVGYAHRNLVVHLDLKPSNILVTAEGAVKLLDFGTSKLLQSDSQLTSTIMATPAYASPEQLRNEPLTTTCDIYSLGVILFELLSGNRPGGKASVAVMMERAIAEREPEKLTGSLTAEAAERRGLSETRLRQALRGDLATIAAKCLSPRPKDRYATLDALAADIQRYLHGHAVLARPQTAWYLTGKFIRRKRRAVIISALVVLALVASLAYAGWRQEQAVIEGQRAIRMQTFLYRLLYLANSNYTGKPNFTVPDFLELGVKLLPDYIKDPADLRKAQMSLAESMYENNDYDGARRVFAQVISNAQAAGDIDTEAESEATRGDIAYLQGDPALGLSLTTRALDLARTHSVAPSVKIWTAVYYATNRERLGFRTDENLQLLEEAARLSSQNNTLPLHEQGDVLYSLGWDLKLRERYPDSERAFNQALAIYAQDPQAKCDQSAVIGELAFIQDNRGDAQGSLVKYRQAWEGLKACAGPESRAAIEQQDRYAGALIEVGRAQEALPILEAAMPIWRKSAGSGPDLAEPLSYLTRAYLATGKDAEAEKSAEEFFTVQSGKVSSTDRRLGVAQLDWAQALMAEHRDRDALPHAELAAHLLVDGRSSEARRMDAEAQRLLAGLRSRLR